MIVTFFSAKNYDDKSKNYGDCILLDSESELVIYDCGSEEHAKRVEQYMSEKNYCKAKFVLSHNDLDHFNGLPYLIERKLISKVYTVLLLKYKDKILDNIKDDRKTRDSIGNQIQEMYNNVDSLSGEVELGNIYDDDDNLISLNETIEFCGPDFNYLIDAISKALDTREGDTIDNETIVNATSVQMNVGLDDKKLLLTGDSSFEALKDNLKEKDYVQLPHHGKSAQAEQIFEENHGKNNVVYYVSDNTGDSNGGSDDLNTIGHIVKNTKNADQEAGKKTTLENRRRTGSYGV